MSGAFHDELKRSCKILENINVVKSIFSNSISTWSNFESQLNSLFEMSISCQAINSNSDIQSHGFADASIKAYEAVVYFHHDCAYCLFEVMSGAVKYSFFTAFRTMCSSSFTQTG